MAYKPEHAVDLDTGAIVAAEIHPADRGDTTTLDGTLKAAVRGLAAAGSAPTAAAPSDLVADKGYHSRAVLKGLADGPWRSRIAEPKPEEVQRWYGDMGARRAVYSNRARLRSGVAKEAFRLRAEKVERSFEHTLDRGDLRRTWLRGRENVRKRYLVHVAAYNLGLVMRLLLGAGTPRELAARGGILLWVADPAAGVVILLILRSDRPPTPPATPFRQRAVKVGLIGSAVAALCCFTPLLVVLLGAVGLSAVVGWLDVVLLPALLLFLGITMYAIWRRQKLA